MVADLYPAATWRPVSYAGAAGPLSTPRGWVLHVPVMNGSPWSTFEFAQPGSRRFSHLWVSKTGIVEQYAALSGKAWHIAAGNDAWWGVEVEGFPEEPMTAAQIEALARWHVWCGAPDHVATTPDEGGISAHYLGGAAWGGHTCPDPVAGAGPRSHQRAAILARAQQIRTGGDDMPLTQADANLVADTVETRYQVHVGTVLQNRDQALGAALADLAAVKAELTTQGTLLAAIATKIGITTP